MIKIWGFADLHFGYQDSKHKYEVLQRDVISNITSDLDAIIIAGDLFHTKLNMTTDAALYVLSFIKDLHNKCIECDVILVIVQGTKTHDFNQLQNFKIFEGLHLSIVERTTVLNLCGLNIGFIPEEYIESDLHEEYYKDIYAGGLDLIFGHGMFDFQSFERLNQESEKPLKNAPTFDSARFAGLTKYGTYFGHIHTPCSKGNVHYIGSYFTFNHGEVGQKSFIELEINTDDNTHEMYRVLNEKDFEFRDIRMSDLLLTNNNDVEKVSKIIEQASKDKFIRIIVDQEIDAVYTNLLKRISVDNDSVSVKFKKQEIEKRVPDEYNFLLDVKMSYDDKITKFIRLKHGIDIPQSLLDKVKKGI